MQHTMKCNTQSTREIKKQVNAKVKRSHATVHSFELFCYASAVSEALCYCSGVRGHVSICYSVYLSVALSRNCSDVDKKFAPNYHVQLLCLISVLKTSTVQNSHLKVVKYDNMKNINPKPKNLKTVS